MANIAQNLNLNPINEPSADVEVTSGYASDLLSDVLAKAKNGAIWATNQKHINIIGVAVMLNLAGVIIAGGIEPDENTVAKAREENIPLYITETSLFDVAGKLYELGLRST
ncbi:MAG: serine kinase [Armatimonadota bacterium]|nr:serine kinase [bacterium]